MSPNQPKTPVSNFRLDDETKATLRRASQQMNVSMTEAVKTAIAALEGFTAAYREAMPEEAAHEAATRYRERRQAQHKRSETAVEALAEFIVDEEWPNAEERERRGRLRATRSRAAAILAGEAWAIRHTWPQAAHEIATRSDWSQWGYSS